MDVEVLVIGGGIAGLQAAIDLGNLGLSVALVERQPSIGGKMIGLSKVFPTLDCCSCICTPRMAEAEHHPRITTLTYAEVQHIRRDGSGFQADVLQKPRYVDHDKCTGCRRCEYACDVELPHEFEGGFGARKAIYVPFWNAVPQVALLDMDNCLLCGRCEKACPVGAIFEQRGQLLLAGLLHICDQAGDAVGRGAATGRSDTVLYGHPGLWQGLRAVLPERQGDGDPVRQGQGAADSRGRGGKPVRPHRVDGRGWPRRRVCFTARW